MCFHDSLCRMSLIAARDTPYLTAASAAVSFFVRISLTSLSVSMAHPWLSPLAPRPFWCISWILVTCLATVRCLGLQHLRTSQLCITTWSSGIAMPEKMSAITWAFRMRPSNQNCPYPPGMRTACQSQQSSGPKICTLLEKRSGHVVHIIASNAIVYGLQRFGANYK